MKFLLFAAILAGSLLVWGAELRSVPLDYNSVTAFVAQITHPFKS